MKHSLSILLLAVMGFSLTSCLKDEDFEDHIYGLTGASGGELITLVGAPFSATRLDYFEHDTTFSVVTVKIASDHANNEDVSVKLVLDNSLIDDYNDENETNYLPAPAGSYTLGNMEVTIPAGQKEVGLPITLSPSNLADDLYALAFRIESSTSSKGVVSKNLGQVVAAVLVKNMWDGEYTNTYVSSLGNGTNHVSLETETPTRVKFNPGLLGIYSNYQALEINPINNQVSVVMTTLLPIITDPSSHYDPATETFYLKWTSSNPTRNFEQTLVREH